MSNNFHWVILLFHRTLRLLNLLHQDPRHINLQKANLYDADLDGADLKGAKFDETTELPNGSYWTSETNMRRFTDPGYQNFWEPEWVTKWKKRIKEANSE